MKKTLFILALSMIGFGAHATPVNPLIADYCAGMGEGLSEDDAQEMIKQCIEEQTQYFAEDTEQYAEEPSELDCYTEGEAILESDPNADYDTVVENCLNRNS